MSLILCFAEKDEKYTGTWNNDISFLHAFVVNRKLAQYVHQVIHVGIILMYF
jgi:hypothetical protein